VGVTLWCGPLVNEAMMTARIFKPCKTAMQSGRKSTARRGCEWVLEFARNSAARPDPLMGWQSSSDTKKQVRMFFPDLASATAYADAHGIAYSVTQPQDRRPKPRAYADNFAFDRNGPWTH
jgi:hypothetical protein